MANHFHPVKQKTSEEGAEITLFRDAHHGFFIGKKGDSKLEPQPLGAFRSEEAAMNWADRHYQGGTWSQI